MSGYQYTYPDDRGYLDVLRPELREVANSLLNQASRDGADLADLVAAADLSDADKAELTEVWR